MQFCGSSQKTSKTSMITNQPFPKQALVFTCLQYKSIENTMRKGEIARNGSPFLNVFYRFEELSCFHQI